MANEFGGPSFEVYDVGIGGALAAAATGVSLDEVEREFTAGRVRFELRERGDGWYDAVLYPNWVPRVYVFEWPHAVAVRALGRTLRGETEGHEGAWDE